MSTQYIYRAAFGFGQVVYLRIKPESCGMVTGVYFRPSGVCYAVTWSHDFTERTHFECELTTERFCPLEEP